MKLHWTEQSLAPDEPRTTNEQRSLVAALKRWVILKIKKINDKRY
jgi:hypothetical protein